MESWLIVSELARTFASFEGDFLGLEDVTSMLFEMSARFLLFLMLAVVKRGRYMND